MMNAVPKPLEMAKKVISEAVKPGDTVVDATLGNGHDAHFLATLVGESGSLYGFDVQRQAVDSSANRLIDVDCEDIQLKCVGHEQMERFVEGEVAAVMFNLGYLPSADKSIISLTETTLQAIHQAQNLLKVNGVISVMCYPGHEGGDEESAAVSEHFSSLSRRDWRVVQYQFINAPNNPAYLILAEKLVS